MFAEESSQATADHPERKCVKCLGVKCHVTWHLTLKQMTLIDEGADMQQEFVASDLEGTLTRGVTWKGMRDFIVANGREREYKRFFRRNLPNLLLFRLICS